jgi:hypothetical protein
MALETFLGTLFGAAFGVIAGVATRYLFQRMTSAATTRAQKSALRKEFEYDRAVVAELSQEAARLRNAINGAVLPEYFGHLGFGRAFFAQTNALANSGKLYEFFSVPDLQKLQGVLSLLSTNNESWVNSEIQKRKKDAVDGAPTYDHAEAVRFLNFLENQIRELDIKLGELISRLS